MSAETVEIQLKQPKQRLFSKKNRKLITDPLDDDNPVTIQVLGICSALAITVQVEQAVVMSFSVLFVLVGANWIISVLRNIIPNRIRIIVQLVVVAFLVIVVNETLKAFLPDVSEKLSVFVGLIITNCIIMGRLEAFAMGNKPWESVLDGFGNTLGYAWVLILVAFVRELFGSGSIYGYPLFEKMGLYNFGYSNNNMMILPPMALIVVGLIIWAQRARNTKLIEQ
ncbi:MAG: NADH:ubiquinone reductase (Na(+)-transporting) subunit D [Bacteroidetes bacterium]|nr:MAG: NADH:ubiquinone reductase (Na(+)-transporting) subunit D [Bacteroidota bacterium]